jgi:hypothetical protein
MKQLYFLLFLLIFENSLFSQTSNPMVEWATYFGGSGFDVTGPVMIDSSDNLILSSNQSEGAKTTTGTHQPTFGGGLRDGMISKMDKSGKLLMSTYFGGPGTDFIDDATVDGNGNIIIVGFTTSTTKIATSNAFQTTQSGKDDGYIAKFKSDGTLLWATYFGGSGSDRINKVSVGTNGDIYFAGFTESTTNIATTNSHQVSIGGLNDGFLAKINSDGVLQWSTYYGGLYIDIIEGMSVSKNNIIAVVGYTDSEENIASSNGTDTTWSESFDGFYAFFDNKGKRLLGSYFGSSKGDDLRNCVFDNQENLIISGKTQSAGLATMGALDEELSGGNDVIISKISLQGKIIWTTYLGGENLDEHEGLSLDKSNNIYLGVFTKSLAFPTSEKTLQGDNLGGLWDAAFTKLSPNGKMIWSTYFGGTDNDRAFDIKPGKDGAVYLAINTATKNLATPGSLQIALNGTSDPLIVKLKEVVSTGFDEVISLPLKSYPNPCIDNLYFDTTLENARITILNQMGQVLIEDREVLENKINVEKLSPGLYFLKLIDGIKNYNATILKL